MSDRHIRRSGSDYTQAFSNLLPQGLAWPRYSTSVLMKLVKGLMSSFGFIDRRAADLLEIETDPRATGEMLTDWERAFGLPDKCVSEPLTVADRRTALLIRMTMMGAQSREFFIEIARRIGYTITITEYRPFMVGIDRVGDNRVIGNGSLLRNEFGAVILNPSGTPVAKSEYSEYPYMLGPDTNRFYWTVHVGLARLSWFRVNSGQVGVDPHLRIGLATDLECILRRYKPAHTDIIFDYSGLATGGSMAGTP